MGVVYVAEDPRLARRIALKVLSKAVAANPDALARFEHEARLLAALNHPNIATIHSLEDDGDLRFFTMELIGGETLDERLQRGALTLDDALATTRQVARALMAAHRQQVVHRDLKPANVMITTEDQVKILDFGIATALGAGGARVGASEGEVAGTPGYMSPEQTRGEPVDERTDIWSFGCLLFECLAGRPAIALGSLPEVLESTRAGRIQWDELPTDTPPRVRALLERCLTQEAAARLPSMTEARRAIDDALAQRALPAGDAVGPAAGATVANNLPRHLASFIGRGRLLDELGRRVEATPLLTLTGTGGSGKTRLAVELARRSLASFPGGVWLVELAAVSDASLLERSVASALGVQEESSRPLAETITRFLARRRALLVLDNCEHLLTACSTLVAELLRGCTELRILATSREGLGLPGEAIMQVPSLELPPERGQRALAELAQNEAVQLFVERASAGKPDFELTEGNAAAVVQVCRRLDGIPLAIELAAARARLLPVDELARRLADRFRILTGGSRTALPRHQTLRATIDWSYDHLNAQEQALLRRLAVFSGGWSLHAAEAVCEGDGIEDWEVLDQLGHLVDKSLVEVGAGAGGVDAEARYRLLETIRQYAFDRLVEKGEAAAVRARHATHYLAVACEAEVHLAGSEQKSWLGKLELEHDNLHAALASFVAEDDGVTQGLRLAAALGRYWLVRGYWSEGRALAQELISHRAAQAPSNDRARVLGWASGIAAIQGEHATARAYAEEGLRIRLGIGDPQGIANSHNDLGIAERRAGDRAAARASFEEALAIWRSLADAAGCARVLNNLALIAEDIGDYDGADRHYAECLELLRRLGDHHGVAVALNGKGSVAFGRRDFQRANEHYEAALALCRQVGNRRTERNVLGNLGLVAYEFGNYDAARSYHEESLAIRRELGDLPGVAASLAALGRVARSQGDAVAELGYAREGLRALGDLAGGERSTTFLVTIARVLSTHDDAEVAARVLGAAAGEARRAGLVDTPYSTADAWVSALRARLGDERFLAASTMGEQLDAGAARALAQGAD